MRSQWSGALELQSVAGTACRFYLLLCSSAEGVSFDCQLLGELATGEDLHRVRALGEPLLPQGLGRHLSIGVETLLQIGEVDRLRFGPEVLKGHRLLHVRPAQLSHPHVDRVLPTLVVGLALRPRTSASPLVSPA